MSKDYFRGGHLSRIPLKMAFENFDKILYIDVHGGK